MLIKVVKEIEQTKHNVTCECRPYICRLFSLILSVKYWTYYNVPLNNVFFLCVLKPVTENCVRKKQFGLNLL